MTVNKLKAGDGLINVGAVTADGLKSITAAKVDLTGAGVKLTGRLGKLTAHDLRDGAAVSAGGAPTAKTTVTAHELQDGFTLTVGSRLTLTAARVGRGTVTAPAIDGLTVTGDKKAHLAADFLADLTVSGVGVAAGPVVNKVKVNGAVTGATWNVMGAVNSVTVGTFTDSQLLVGFLPDPFGILAGSFTGNFGITQFTATGVKGVAGPAFANSVVAAATVGRVTLASVAEDNGGLAYGILAETAIGTVKVPGVVLAPDPGRPGDQQFGDFRLRVL